MKYLKIKFPEKRGEKFISMSDFDLDILNNSSAILLNRKDNSHYHINSVRILKMIHNNSTIYGDCHTKIELCGYISNTKKTHDYIELEGHF
jgi:hypothetical protein